MASQSTGRMARKLPFKPTALGKSDRPDAPRPSSASPQLADSSPASRSRSPSPVENELNLFRRSGKVFPIAAGEAERAARLNRSRLAQMAHSDSAADDDESDHSTGSSPASAINKSPRTLGSAARHSSDRSHSVKAEAEKSVRQNVKRFDSSFSHSSNDDECLETELYSQNTPRKRPRLLSRSQSIGLISPVGGSSRDRYTETTSPSPSHKDANASNPVRRTGRAGLTSNGSLPPRQPVIELIDSDDEAGPPKSTVGILTPIDSPIATDLPSSEKPAEPAEPVADEFQIYIDRARARQQKADAGAQTSTMSADGEAMAGSASATVVDVLVTSPVPGTEPIKVKIRPSQRLRLLRNAWCTKQQQIQATLASGKTMEQDEIILTWRRKRIYDTTTLASLGIGPHSRDDRDGSMDVRQLRGHPGSWCRIHLEAWTTALYDDFQREESRARRITLGEAVDDDDLNGDGDGDGRSAAGRSGAVDGQGDGDSGGGDDEAEELRVILKAKDAEPVRIAARASTTMETLAAHFRRVRAVPSDRRIDLVFDGERLQAHVTVADADLADMDTLEVHFR